MEEQLEERDKKTQRVREQQKSRNSPAAERRDKRGKVNSSTRR